MIHCRAALPFRHDLFLLKEQTNGRVVLSNNVVGYVDRWQYPAITEKHAFDLALRDLPSREGWIYFGFPWATLIDLAVHNPSETPALLEVLKAFQPRLRLAARVVTVCQHIYLKRFSHWLVEAGVTDVFWSHAVIGEPDLPDGLRIHPFPLFPVQTWSTVLAAASQRPMRRFLFSFVGARAYADIYLSPVRNWIIELLGSHPMGFVRSRDVWHYQKTVYDRQILGNQSCQDSDDQLEAEAEFQVALAESVFALCPSGSGPNSIRLWEAISLGAIPVILSDSWRPPGDRELWEAAAVFWPETHEAVMALPGALTRLAGDEMQLSRKRLALAELSRCYGPDNFIYDISQLWTSDTPYPRCGLTDARLAEICAQTIRGNDEHEWGVCRLAVLDRARRSPAFLRKAWQNVSSVRQAVRVLFPTLVAKERQLVAEALYSGSFR